MRICAISDTHGQHDGVNVPECDVLIHCGDYSNLTGYPSYRKFIDWFAKQPAKYKVFICGNHDSMATFNYFKEDIQTKPEFESLFYLQDSSIDIEGVIIYGTPWSPEFMGWEWMLPANSVGMADVRNKIDSDTNILVSHCPPFGILDQCDDMRLGCELLHTRIKELKKLEHALFGHIHSGYGQSFCGQFANCAVLNNQYRIANDPIIIDL